MAGLSLLAPSIQFVGGGLVLLGLLPELLELGEPLGVVGPLQLIDNPGHGLSPETITAAGIPAKGCSAEPEAVGVAKDQRLRVMG